MDQKLLQKSQTVDVSEPLIKPTLQKSQSMDLPKKNMFKFYRASTLGNARKSLRINPNKHEEFKTLLRRNVLYAFLLIIFVVLERIFSSNLHGGEDDMIIWLQQAFGVGYNSFPPYLSPFLLLESHLKFSLLLAHAFVILYYLMSPVVCLKIMHVTLNALLIFAILETLFGEPRPFWMNADINGVTCQGSYGFPSFSLFGTTFLIIYTIYCFKHQYVGREDLQFSLIQKILIYTALFLLVNAIILTKVLTGSIFFTQALVTLGYVVATYAMVVLFNKSLTSLIEKSSMNVQAAKRYTIFWLLYLITVGAISAFIYNWADDYIDITYAENFVKALFTLFCLTFYSRTALLRLGNSMRI